MKSFLKNILVKVLGWQVRRLRKKHNFKIIGVVGSIGKTSTKLAIAKVLAAEKRVRYQEGNYNDIVSVPLVFFGHSMPLLQNIFKWFWIILQNEFQIYFSYPFDIVVVELGTDAPGQINQFRKYLHLDIAVITAIAPEHMEFFKNLENVAEEEWSVNYFSDLIFANRDLCQIVPANINRNKIIFYNKSFDAVYCCEVISPVQLYSISIATGICVRSFRQI
jgi:UDP-N-acetylmuramoyl-tripeptide--D-alanyl-D-alanine ligase